MAEKHLSPVSQYLCSMQSMFFHPTHASTPAIKTWPTPAHNEVSQHPLQFTGQVRPTPQSTRAKPYIAVNQGLGLNQENIQIMSNAIWDQGRSWPNKVQVVSQSQGRAILGMHNHEHTIVSIMNKVEKSTIPEAINGSDWPMSGDNSRENSGYSSVLKRPRPSTPVLRKDNGWQPINQNGSGPPTKSHCRSSFKRLGVNTSVPPPSLSQRVSPQQQENNEKNERYFKPLPNSPSNPVELHVTNLDQNIDSLELKETLMAAFREHIMVLHLSIFIQSDGNLAASVKVPSVQDAQYAISQLHRRKVGHKRIMIAYAHSGSSQNPQFIRSQIYSLLSEVPGYRLPLFTFRDLFESRYLTSLSVSELYRMRDVCIITEENSGRTIYLNPDYRNTPSPRICSNQKENGQHNMEVPYCIRHGRSQQLSCEKGWAEQELPTLPNIRVKLSVFSENIQALLGSHNDFLPLASLMDCYAAEFEPLEADETGVPLEHLVTWVPNVELALNLGCVKYLRTAETKACQLDKPEDGLKKCASPSLANELSLFSRELVDLLKTQPKNNQLMFNRFIPAYHHHFGRQCRVADYGFTKLIDLFEALPHVIQVIGEGNKRIVTLSHRAQIRRFTSDLLRVLKSQANKQLKVSELSSLFESTLGRAFDPVDYGLSYLEDLLAQLSENIVVVSGTGPSTLIAIPKRDQTPEEIDRTKRFAVEVIELLSHAPQCSMFFSKFIPAYHHHYGHQCRVSDYGFTKLIDLFEAIPHIVKIEDSAERERRVTLTNDKKIIVLSNQIVDLVRSHYPPGMPISALSNAFLRQFGYALKPMTYGCDDLNQLMEKLKASIKVVNFNNELILTPVDQTEVPVRQLLLRIFRVLMVKEDAKMTFSEFYNAYQSLYNEKCSLELLENELKDFVKVTHRGGATIELTPIQLFARNVYELMYMADGRIARSSFDSMYTKRFGKSIKPAQYNCQSFSALLNAISHIVVQGNGGKQTLILNEELESVGIPLPPGFHNGSSNYDDNNKMFQNGSSTEIQNGSQQQHTPFRNQKALIQGLANGQNYDSNSSNKSSEEQLWQKNDSSYFNYGGQVPVINLPEPCTPPDPEECASLLSPYKTLLPATVNPFCYSSPRKKRIISPHPSELPLPQSYLTNGNTEPIAEGDESADSGLVTSTVDLAPECDSGSSSSSGTLSNNSKRKIRLAAQFDMPLD